MPHEHELPPKNAITPESNPYFKPIAPYWGWIPWNEVITKNNPVLKLKFDNTEDDWALFFTIKVLANETGIDFEDAASWVLHRALANRVEDARKMAQGVIPWDTEVRHICRVMSLLTCKLYDEDIRHTLEKVDQMIWSLLITEDELLECAPPGNRLAC